MFLHVICESASRIRHIGLENLKNYCRSFSSSRAQKRCALGDTAPLRQARESLSLDTPSVRYITYLRSGCTSILRSRYFFVFSQVPRIHTRNSPTCPTCPHEIRQRNVALRSLVLNIFNAEKKDSRVCPKSKMLI